MTEDERAQAVQHAVKASHDSKTRRLLWLFGSLAGVFMLVTAVLVTLVVLTLNRQVNAGAEMISAIQDECDRGQVKASICRKADDAEKEVKQGPPGIPGVAGPSGPPGKDGSPGPRGPSGAAGSPGADGSPGTNGEDGEDGTDGLNGADGADGQPGKDGSPGPIGPMGATGATGPRGPEGKSAYPFTFEFEFTNRNGRTFECVVSFNTEGEQDPPTVCTDVTIESS